MRVLHLSSLYPPVSFGGAERVVETLAEGAAARGDEVSAAYLTERRAVSGQRNGVAVHPLRHRNPLWIETSATHSGLVRKVNKVATLFNALTHADFKRVLVEVKPDIVHSHSMVELTPAMWRAARQSGAAVVHTLHDYDLLCIRAALFMDGKRCDKLHRTCAAFSRVKRLFHGEIDHVVGVSNSILQTHLDHGLFAGLTAAQRHVVWNPVQLSPTVIQAPPRSQDRPFTFGYLGRLVPEKGVEVLLRACRQVGESGWTLKLAGKAPGDDTALRRAMEGTPAVRVGFVDPAEFLRDIDVLIVPSIWLEPFGLTIVEAYAAGVPVIGSDIAGVAEIVGAVDPSALFAPGDSQALAQVMAGLVRRGRDSLLPVRSAEVLARTRPDFAVDRYREIYALAVSMRTTLAEAVTS